MADGRQVEALLSACIACGVGFAHEVYKYIIKQTLNCM